MAAADASASAPMAMAAGYGKIKDMTHTISPDFPTYLDEPGYAA
ncbi:hypothetical protein [Ruegeria sp. HKCCA5426]|nr:hypothetical protein [Ruegeria sp. HKCCA5426]